MSRMSELDIEMANEEARLQADDKFEDASDYIDANRVELPAASTIETLPPSALPALVSVWNVLEVIADCRPAHLRSLLRMVRRYNAKLPDDIKDNTYAGWSRARCIVALLQEWVDGRWHKDHRMKLADYWAVKMEVKK